MKEFDVIKFNQITILINGLLSCICSYYVNRTDTEKEKLKDIVEGLKVLISEL